MDDRFYKLSVDSQLGLTLAHQIKQQVTWMIVSGELKPGDRLPTIRELAGHLSVNLHTVRSAYQIMETEDLVETRRGLGTEVLRFDPVRIAQSAISMRTHTVGVILPTVSNPFYHAFLQGVDEVADLDQTLLFVCITQEDPAQAWRYFAQLSTRQVDGIIIASHDFSRFFLRDKGKIVPRDVGFPLVTVDWPESPTYSVLIDLENAGYQATRHLLAHGHRRVGLITFAEDLSNVAPVNAGYQRALQGAGIQVDPGLMARLPGFDMPFGAEGARRLLALPQPPTAIFAISDMLAIGALTAIKDAGMRVPQDIALAGFNDIAMAAFVNPPLTTVTAPGHKMGQEAMKMLNCLIAGEVPAHQQVLLPSTLVIRQSCGSH